MITETQLLLKANSINKQIKNLTKKVKSEIDYLPDEHSEHRMLDYLNQITMLRFELNIYVKLLSKQ